MEVNLVLDAYFQKQETRQYAKGDILFATGQAPIGIIQIQSGFIQASTQAKNNTQYLHVMYGPGDTFPVYWMFEDGLSPLDYVAFGPLTVKVAGKADFVSHLGTDVRLSNAVAHHIMLQYRSYADRVANLQLRYASERLAYRLMQLGQKYGVSSVTSNDILIDVPLTHQIIGNSINLSRESTSRELEKLRKKGVIAYNGRQIVITDKQALQKIIG